ncbi:MAG: hydroxymethylbilane synthase [Gammaproteobacteria bacterium RIFCSPHIGHO2_12_FULL_38_14]|nr:MAG: hydroxymethylbilane synthase [Gammaproteobacteria bacterium RIFCSPHIGHO2_12_FULL_38_14]
MTKRHLTIATRESPLAIKQAELVKAALLAAHPHLSVELLGITTRADKLLNTTLFDIGGKGLFVKELEEALLDGRADMAVHSMKDVPMDLPDELMVPVILHREDARDVFISNRYHSFGELPQSAIVGTSSLRRQTQLRAIRSDVLFQDLRGNIQTRLARLDKGDFDAIVLAAAGLKRMALQSRLQYYFSIDDVLPAAGQGALGIECLKQNHVVLDLIAPLNDVITFHCVMAERAFCRRLESGCHAPVAAFAQVHHDQLSLAGLVADQKGHQILKAKRSAPLRSAEEVGERLACELLERGADKLL